MSTRREWARRAALAIAQVALLAWQPATAAGTGGSSFGADDPAAISCELFTTMHEKAPTGTERQFYNWAQGYFAGRSAAGPAAAGRELPAAGDARTAAFGKLLAFCGKNPSATFGAAVAALWTAPR